MAAGVADHLGVDVLFVRLGFVFAVWVNGIGVIAYLLLWRLMPLATPAESPGLESAERRGLRRRAGLSTRETAQTIAVVAFGLGIGLVIQATGRGIAPRLILPVSIALIGIVLVWRQFDDSSWDRWLATRGGWRAYFRSGLGLALVAFALFFLLTQERGWDAILDLASAVVVALIGIGLIVGPWIARILAELSAERQERIRSQERADVAAHLHDSVLQTLALLQKNATDPAAVATLARRQERELRSWLYNDQRRPGESLVAALTEVAGDVEAGHRIPVELVSVGDIAVNDDVHALIGAAREAMINAAKHSGAMRIDVYAEVADRTASVFVRDRGAGFDPAAIGEDRMGIAGSIVGRMKRHGGHAAVVSRPGEGTEVRLTLEVDRETVGRESP